MKYIYVYIYMYIYIYIYELYIDRYDMYVYHLRNDGS